MLFYIKILTIGLVSMVQVVDYLDERLVLFFDSVAKEELLAHLVNVVFDVRNLPEKERFYTSILEREKLISTAIGVGVAIPHAKRSVYSDFFISIAILQKGIEWDAIDDSLVRIVFLIGGPDNRQTDYLQLLSSVTSIMNNENLRKRLMASTTPHDVITLLRGAFSD